MPVPALLERDAPLQLLHQQLQALRGGGGRCLLLAGEAGVGKTSLLRAAQAQAPAGLEWLNGLCEPLLSPSPWGPLLDWLEALPPSLGQLIARGRPAQEVMPEALSWLRRRSQPLVLCVDDLQWADGASLDLLRFLGRRIEALPVLLVLAFRDDELGPEHALHGVLAGLPACTRVALQPLSEAAVAQAVRAAGRKPQGVYRLTRGNPFLLHEWLASDPQALPATVREAVLARSRRLTPEARAGLEQLAVSPVPLERELLDALGLRRACDEALGSGLLTEQGPTIGFRHELARQAFEDSLPPGRRQALHARLFEQLAQAPAARRLHHAEGAGLAAELQRLAPLAAAEAARAGDHREAAHLLALALRQQPPEAPRAELLLQLAAQCELFYALEPARRALEQAVALFEQLGQPAALGQAQSRLARTLFLAGELQAGKQLARTAIQGLEALGQPAGLAMAYAVMAQLHLLDASQAAALHWGRRALAQAEAEGDTASQVHALNTVGCAELAVADLPEAWARLQQSLRTALQLGWAEAAARAYTNLLVHQIVHRHHARWPALCDEALAYCAARDFDLYSLRLRLRRAHGWSETGRWAEAQAELEELLGGSQALSGMDRQQAEHLLALLQLRKGGGGRTARAYWNALLDGERRLQPWPWYAPVPVAALEAAWLLGRRDTLLRWAREWLGPSVAAGEPWRSGQIAVWLRRLGALRQLPEIPLAAPCEAELRGDLDAAATAWAAAGNPYEQALSLLGGTPEQVQRALALFERLGAQPAAALARRRLHEAGSLGGLRGRGQATRADPLGLTA
ncbi:ATP-binding protein, partial [Inhella proteolytica]